ncbi:S-adenosyl-L-methionine-dependent methyltransferase [Cyathus striatus]|nr:S-adenosyl-L-methionine-dependent methyltransferase [Cyathus striatus]
MSSNAAHIGKAQLIQLTNLISSAVRDVLSEYDAVGASVPLLESTETGPFDSPEDVTPKLAKAIRTIEAACAQLSFAVASPGHVITNKAYGFEEPACMLVVTEAKIADILVDKPEGLHVNEIAKKTGLPAGKLGRIMRVLATKHCFNEVKPDNFANNRLSLQLISSNPVSGLVGHMTDECMKASSFLNDTLVDPSKAFSSLPKDSPFQMAHGYDPFEFYTTPKGKPRTDRFAQAMVGWGEVTGRSMLPKVYPWDKVAPGSTICDVGGGNGHATLDLVKVFPSLKVVLQDLPEVVEQGKDYWAKQYPNAIETQSIQFVPTDFFKDTPVKGCNFYYLRHVLHDWPDSECLKILQNVRKALDVNGRLLIHEFVLQHAVREPSDKLALDQAPEPLLANYGIGRARMYQQDINMMSLMNSKERTLQEFLDLANQTGFKFEHLWDSGEAGLLEFTLA